MKLGSLEGLNVVMVGDLRYGRTTHSLSHALVRFGAKITLVSTDALKMPDEIVSDLKIMEEKLLRQKKCHHLLILQMLST